MRFFESLKDIGLRYYALRYGDDEARILMSLHGKEREKRLAMLDEHGSHAGWIIRHRERDRVLKIAQGAEAICFQLEGKLHALELRKTHLQVEFNALTDEKDRERWKATLNLNENHIAECRSMLEVARQTAEVAASEFKALEPIEEEELPEVRIESTPPHALPLDEGKVAAITMQLCHGMEVGTSSFYCKVFGKKKYREILELDSAARLKAVEEVDIATLGKERGQLEAYLIYVRNAAVATITTKNSLLRVVDYVRSIVDDIAEDTEDPTLKEKLETGKRILPSLEAFFADAVQIVEELKSAARTLGTRVDEATQDLYIKEIAAKIKTPPGPSP